MSASGRYLDLVVRLLPASRSEWGRAMQGELATIERPSERWLFALGCTRVALARRPAFLRRARPERAARAVRAGGYFLIALSLLTRALPGSGNNWAPVFLVLMAVVTLVLLAITSEESGIVTRGLATGALAGLVAGAAGFAVLPFERIGTPLSHHLPGPHGWLVLVVFGAPLAAALLTAREHGRDQGVLAALLAGTVGAVVVALLGLAAIVLFPSHVPDIVGPVMPASATAAQRQAENAIEASDPYAGMLLLGALFAAVLGLASWAGRFVAARPRSADLT
jgi:hypothetical protein